MFTVPVTTITSDTTVPPPPPFFNPLQQQATPTSTPTTFEATTSTHALPDFASVFSSTKEEEVTTQLPQILPQAVSDFATPVIEKNVAESLEAVVLTRSSSQP
ncbi:hypothetical protein Tco_0068285 [Tanacetum coccineum]